MVLPQTRDVIKYYKRVSNSLFDNSGKEITVENYVMRYLKRIGISVSHDNIIERCSRYKICIKLNIVDRMSGRVSRVVVQLKVRSVMTTQLQVLNAFEDIVIYNFYSFGNIEKITKIDGVRVLLERVS